MAEKKNKDQADSMFAYDDAYRTMEGECDDIVIPFVNYVFNEHYDNTAKIRRLRNEHYVEKDGSDEEKRVTDSHFEITQDGITKKFHVECESRRYDGSILIRLFEYDTQIALDNGEWNRKTLRLRFPYSGLLLLRSSRNTPDQAEIVVETPGGTVEYPINILKVSDFTIDEIFEKRLYMLIPFYIFNFEKELKQIAGDEKKMDALAKLYDEIVERLNADHEKGFLSALSYGVIINMTKRVLKKLTKKHSEVQKKVGDAMGGRVLDLPEIRAYHQGLAEREEEVKKLEDDNQKLSAKNKELEADKEGLSAKNKELEEDKIELNKKVEQLYKEIERLKKSNK